MTSSGTSVDAIPVPGWAFQPGQAAYFPVVAPDGTVVIANEPQTDNQLLPTARQMVISTFDAPRLRFANVVIPTSTGKTTLGGIWPDPSGIVGGGDISDIGVVRTGATTRVMFTSAMPFWGWNAARGGEFPTLGALQRSAAGTWTPDATLSTTASQLASAATRSARATRARAARASDPRTRRAARRAASAVSAACTARSYPATGRFGDCRMPAEFAQLPASQALAVTQYAFDDPARPSGRLSVLSPQGRVLASYAYPAITLSDGTTLAVHPREVDADPLGRMGDERFVVIFDAERGTGHAGEPAVAGAMQEFRYDARASTITPTSAPVVTGDRDVTGTLLGVETAQYAADGSLWAAQSAVGTLQAGALAVYARPSASRGVLGDRAACAASPSWSGQAWGRACAPDSRIDAAAALGIARSLNEDPATGTMVLTTMSGAVLPIRETGGTPVAGTPIDLGLNRLADRTVVRIGPRKAALDPARHLLWIPVQQLQTDRTCAAWPCAPQRLAQWLYAVDLAKLGG